MIDYVEMLREFHSKYGHFISNRPQRHDTIPDRVMVLRLRLIHEELKEFEEAEDRVDIADALADLLYAVFGTCVSYGIPIDEIFAEVHRSNMTKSTELDEYGKTIKGVGWKPPEIEAVLRGEE